MQRIILLFLAAVIALCPADADARRRKARRQQPQRSIETVQREHDAAKREMQQTDRKISDNRRQTKLQLDSLESLRREKADIQERISSISAKLDSADLAIAQCSDSIATLERRADRLRDNYREMLRRMQSERGSTANITFIFSASSFRQAWQRVRYLRQFGIWQKERTAELREASARVGERRKHLEELRANRASDAQRLSQSHAELASQEQRSERLVASLRQHGADLASVLREQEKRAQKLNQELDRLIAAEQQRIEKERREQERREREQLAARNKKKKPAAGGNPQGSASKPSTPSTSSSPEAEDVPMMTVAETDRRLSGSFANNKGRLLFPVDGSYRIVKRFGKQKHPDMPHVVTENNGIDIEVKPGTNARAVFAGKVASILQVPGYNYVVMVRHGNYLTVYSGLEKPAVRTGQDIKANQTIARVMTDPERAGRGVLHFELRYNSRKYNPLEWVK